VISWFLKICSFEFSLWRYAAGSNPMAAKDALMVYRHFSRDNPAGMSLRQWLECVEWLVTISQVGL
jgi:hypothetical protein